MLTLKLIIARSLDAISSLANLPRQNTSRTSTSNHQGAFASILASTIARSTSRSHVSRHAQNIYSPLPSSPCSHINPLLSIRRLRSQYPTKPPLALRCQNPRRNLHYLRPHASSNRARRLHPRRNRFRLARAPRRQRRLPHISHAARPAPLARRLGRAGFNGTLSHSRDLRLCGLRTSTTLTMKLRLCCGDSRAMSTMSRTTATPSRGASRGCRSMQGTLIRSTAVLGRIWARRRGSWG